MEPEAVHVGLSRDGTRFEVQFYFDRVAPTTKDPRGMGSGAGQLIRPNELDDKQANWFWLDAAENGRRNRRNRCLVVLHPDNYWYL